MRFVLLALFLFLFAGCGSAPPAASPWTSTAEIPPDLLSVARKKLPQVKFDTARKIKVKGADAFEIRGKQPNGKVREVEVLQDGTIVEVE
ncbi:MAG TPA: hypothetical protein VHY91_22600 [Pirellulales bacterium]|jgi:hypothetical protein|nr:hypothetical protein [Pirellulales bacterium]